jgi:hypothetical protein
MDSNVGFAIFLVVAVVILVVSLTSKSKKRQVREAEIANRANETPGEAYRRLHGAFRGELNSPGTSPRFVGKHSVNCECIFCLYGHDPDKPGGCRCKACTDPASVYGGN